MSAQAPVGEARQEEHPAERSAPSIWRVGLQRYAILIVFAALIVGFGVSTPRTFMSLGNLSNILGSQAVLFILVMAVMLPTVIGDFVDWSWRAHTVTLLALGVRIRGRTVLTGSLASSLTSPPWSAAMPRH